MDPRRKEVQIAGLDRALTVHLHSSHDQYISEGIAELGYWEPLETEIVRRLVGPGTLLLDCGANLGWYSLVAAARGAEVIAFEPEPRNLELLRTNLRTNGLEHLVDVRAVALGSRTGTGSLQLSDDNQGDHRVSASPVGHTIDIDIVRLDDVVGGRRPSVIKLDTQGSEVAIFRGGHHTFAPEAIAQTAIIIEFWPYGLVNCGSSAEELIGLLTPALSASHLCFEVSEPTSTLIPMTLSALALMAREGDYSPEGQGHTNLLVLPIVWKPFVDDLIDWSKTGSDRVEDQLLDLRAAEESVYSQNGEDGVLAALARRTGAAHVAVEIGASSGIECNTRLLRERGWQVIAFDGDTEGSDWVRTAFVTAENINDVLSSAGAQAGIGVLTIDVDGNDFWLLRQLDQQFLPAILVVEYNATLGPVDHLTVPYRSSRRWDHSNYFGASLAALTLLARDRGFELVYCESCGANAFFVNRALLEQAGLVPVPVHRAYRPPKYGLVGPLGEHTGHLQTSRRFVRVDSVEAATRAYRSATGRGVTATLRRGVHWTASSDAWRFRAEWRASRRAARRGAGPTK